MKRSARCLTMLGVLLGASFAHAKELPNFDASYQEVSPNANRMKVFRSNAPERVAIASTDSRSGLPSFVWGVRDPSAPVPLKVATKPDVAARSALSSVAARIGLPAQAIESTVVREVDTSGEGGILVRFGQEVDGVEVFRGKATVLLDRAHRMVAASNNLHPAAIAGSKRISRNFTIAPADAIVSAMNDLHETVIPLDRFITKGLAGRYELFDFFPVADLEFARPARVKKVYFPLGQRLVPAYFLEMSPRHIDEQGSDAYAYVIAADDARVLYRENLTHTAFNYRVWADPQFQNRPLDGPQADYNPHPFGIPDGSSPAFIPPVLVSMDGFNTNPEGTFDPWLPANATETTGNNVEAYADRSAQVGFTPNSQDVRATTTSAQTFDRVYDTSANPNVSQAQVMAAVTQLFYLNNYLHDYWYDSGFNEAAGNAQSNNFGRGGAGNDVLRAEAQDYSGTNNANMQAFGDGQSPIMQMYLWDAPQSGGASLVAGGQNYAVGVAGFGPTNFNIGPAQIVVAQDGSTADSMGGNTGSATDACQTLTGNYTGRIVLADRGACNFVVKVKNIQNAGGIGAIIANNAAGLPPNPMGGQDGTITIGTVGISQADGAALKQKIAMGNTQGTMSRSGSAQRDGTIDGLIAAHEWGHYIHNRLVSCGSKMCGAEGEGWGDFFALHMSVREGDDLDGTYSIAMYSTAVMGDSGYYGIRRIPYSVTADKNSLTFKHIMDGQALPTNNDMQPLGGPNSEVHNAGEIWASMMWEALVAILKRSQQPGAPYNFEQGRRRMANYVVAGMKLAPADPTFLEQRDAILAAAAAADIEDMKLIAQAFAKRGAGSCAISPPTDSTNFGGVIESFEVKATVSGVAGAMDDSIQSCDGDGKLDAQERGRVTVELMNTGISDLTDAVVTVSASKPVVIFPNGTSANFGTIKPFETGKVLVEVELDGSVTNLDSVSLDITITSAQTCVTKTTTVEVPYIHYDNVPNSSTTDTVESDIDVWTRSGTDAENVWQRKLEGPPNHVWHGEDTPSPSDTSLESPPITAGAGPVSIVLKHRWDFETGATSPQDPTIVNFDGAVLEISTDNGQSWQDVSAFGGTPYNGTITDISGNVLGNRQGFVALSPGHPALTTTTINLNNSIANKVFKMRFRIGTDPAAGATGWDIDEITVEGASDKPFPSIVPNVNGCAGLPIADAGPDFTVGSGQTASLDGTNSKDPDGDQLTFTWTQLDGPAVTIDNASTAKASFVAPDVTVDTTITLQLTVSDGKGASSDTVQVLVKPAGEGTGGGRPGLVLEDGGCGCVAAGASSTPPAAPISALGLLGLAIARLRRRRS